MFGLCIRILLTYSASPLPAAAPKAQPRDLLQFHLEFKSVYC